MNIVPSINTDKSTGQQVLAQLRVPVRNFGKVAIGQSVHIYLDNFPHQEYGTISGTVRSLSALPKQGYYRVTVAFPNGLTTQYGKEIPFTQQLSGTGRNCHRRTTAARALDLSASVRDELGGLTDALVIV